MGALFAAVTLPLSFLFWQGGMHPQPLVAGMTLLFSLTYGIVLIILMMIAARIGVGQAPLTPTRIIHFSGIFTVLFMALIVALVALQYGRPNALPGSPITQAVMLIEFIGPPSFLSFSAYVVGLMVRDWRRA